MALLHLMDAVKRQPTDDVFEGPETQKHLNTLQAWISYTVIAVNFNNTKYPLLSVYDQARNFTSSNHIHISNVLSKESRAYHKQNHIVMNSNHTIFKITKSFMWRWHKPWNHVLFHTSCWTLCIAFFTASPECIYSSFLPPQSLFSKPLSLRELRQDYLLFMAWLLFCHFHLANPKERGNEKDVMAESNAEKCKSQLSLS